MYMCAGLMFIMFLCSFDAYATFSSRLGMSILMLTTTQ